MTMARDNLLHLSVVSCQWSVARKERLAEALASGRGPHQQRTTVR
jgi:hypothetical protein